MSQIKKDTIIGMHLSFTDNEWHQLKVEYDKLVAESPNPHHEVILEIGNSAIDMTFDEFERLIRQIH